MPRRTFNSLDRLREDVADAEKAYLRQHGWQETSATPGCYWLWVKQIPDGALVMVEQNMAILMQSRSIGKW